MGLHQPYKPNDARSLEELLHTQNSKKLVIFSLEDVNIAANRCTKDTRNDSMSINTESIHEEFF
tara:strand:+ start:58 stop:249 length:192 start_codon:yes stop_codon:yes gene_type:complete